MTALFIEFLTVFIDLFINSLFDWFIGLFIDGLID